MLFRANRTSSERTNGPPQNERSRYPDARLGSHRFALHLWPQCHWRAGSLVGRLYHICPCSWRWRSWRRGFSGRRLSRGGVLGWCGFGVFLLRLQGVLSLLLGRPRLFFTAAKRLFPLPVVRTPRSLLSRCAGV